MVLSVLFYLPAVLEVTRRPEIKLWLQVLVGWAGADVVISDIATVNCGSDLYEK